MPPTLRQLIALMLIALAPALVSAAVQLQWRANPPLEPGEVRPATARLWAARVLWVDARPGKRARRIEDAVSLNTKEWESRLPAFFAAWSAEKTVVVYDQNQESGDAANVAARLRDELKIDPVYVLKGGYEAWRR
ncbi:MAG: rhodanese [Chthoniobacteraceae bacterium]|nr:rhodanese [Chthoniobacteraceae bacterium]